LKECACQNQCAKASFMAAEMIKPDSFRGSFLRARNNNVPKGHPPILATLKIDRSRQAFIAVKSISGDSRNLLLVDDGLAILHNGSGSSDEDDIKALPKLQTCGANFGEGQGMPYSNGFLGTVERLFNPATFRYSLAEQRDLSTRRWSSIDCYLYLCKLQGSINWVETGKTLFPLRELQSPPKDCSTERVMI
jgi:hypothetical protein